MKLITLLLALFFLFLSLVPKTLAQEKQAEYIEATVTKISDSSTIIESNGNSHPYQKLQLLGNSGSLKGQLFTIENGKYNLSNIIKYNKGDRLIVTKNKSISGQTQLYISDYSRTIPLYTLVVVFVLLTIIIGGKRGASSLLGMVLTFVMIFAFVLPQISSGHNPLLITSITAFIVIPTTFLLSHGVNSKTLSAIVSTFLVLLITGFIAQFFINWAHLSGFVSEEAGFLNTLKQGSLDIKGLLFAGIIIALLGILEDISIAQAAIVVQIKKANNKLSNVELFKRAMDVGKDHIASMANTLILVYAGASLPLLLLFINNPLPVNQVLNSEIIAEELVRTLTASIGLIITVPITTFLTILIIRNSFKKTLNLG